MAEDRTREESESQDSDAVDISDTTAPSIGPNTVIEKDDPEERLARHEQSDTDAMGLDKRRPVMGGSYGPSVGRQVTLYAIFIALVVALAIGFKVLADNLDEPPKQIESTAPWAQDNAPQVPARSPDVTLP